MGRLHVLYYFSRIWCLQNHCRFYKSLLWNYLCDLRLVKPDGFRGEVLAECWRRPRVRVWLEVRRGRHLACHRSRSGAGEPCAEGEGIVPKRSVSRDERPSFDPRSLIPPTPSFPHFSYNWTPGHVLPTPHPKFWLKCGPKDLPFTTSDTSRSFQKIIELLNQNKWEINLETTLTMKMFWHVESRFLVLLKHWLSYAIFRLADSFHVHSLASFVFSPQDVSTQRCHPHPHPRMFTSTDS